MRVVVIALLTLLLQMPIASATTVENTSELPKLLQQGLQKLADLRGFSCRFEQLIYYEDGTQQHYQGRLAVAKGGYFRWQYEQPYEQLYISNGKGVWLYEPDLMQAQWLDSLDAVDPVAMRLLEGRVKHGEVVLLDATLTIYHIRVADTELWLSLDIQGLPRWFETKDRLGNRNRMKLLSIEQHKPAMQQFEFTPPKGVDVMDAAGRILEQ